MKIIKIISVLSILVLFTSCGAKVKTIVDKSYNSLPSNSKVMVLTVSQGIPIKTESLGVVKIYDSGFSTKCNYNTVIIQAKNEVRKNGGNILKITDHKKPSFFGSSCHRITALMLKTDDLNNISFEKDNEEPLEVPTTTLQELNNLGKKFKIIVHGGYSYRTTKIDSKTAPLIKDYIKGIKSGYNLSADINYFFSDNYGVGIKYSQSKASNKLSDLTITFEDGSSAYGNMEDNISLSYIGASYVSRLVFGANNNVFFYDVSIGYLGYFNDGEDIGVKFQRKTATLGTSYTIGLEVPFTPSLALCVKAGMISGVFNKSTITYLDGSTSIDDRKENLNRIDLSLGLVFSM